ncbi:ankyrin repeat-containing domain protein [Aspergillus oleicola]
MPLLSLPSELILLIAEKMDSERDINAFSQTNKLVNSITTDFLYNNNVQNHNSTALIWASKRGRSDIARRILGYGANVDTRDNCGMTPFLYAAKKQHLDMTRLLLDHGADIHAMIIEDMDKPDTITTGPAIRDAVVSGRIEMVELLLSRRADSNDDRRRACSCTGSNPLEIAIEDENRELVELLLRHGADFEKPCYSGTPLRLAVGLEDVHVMFKLQSLDDNNGAVIDEHGASLQDLCCVPHTCIVQLLMERGADVNAIGGRFQKALEKAEVIGRADIKSFLLAQMATL